MPAPAAQVEFWLKEIARQLQELDGRLGTRQPPPVEVRTRRNRNTMGSLRLVKEPTPRWRFIVAEDLLRSQPELVRDLGCLLLHRARRRPAPRELAEALARLRALWVKRQPRSTTAQPKLKPEHDPALSQRLQEVSTQLGQMNTSLPEVVWISSESRRILGRYDSRARRIEIHRALRQPSVPSYVLNNLLAHELLHCILGPRRHGNRLVHHHAEFRAHEQGFPDYDLAENWMRRVWPRLVSAYLKRERQARS